LRNTIKKSDFSLYFKSLFFARLQCMHHAEKRDENYHAASVQKSNVQNTCVFEWISEAFCTHTKKESSLCLK
jgi:hypothetical protein